MSFTPSFCDVRSIDKRETANDPVFHLVGGEDVGPGDHRPACGNDVEVGSESGRSSVVAVTPLLGENPFSVRCCTFQKQCRRSRSCDPREACPGPAHEIVCARQGNCSNPQRQPSSACSVGARISRGRHVSSGFILSKRLIVRKLRAGVGKIRRSSRFGRIVTRIRHRGGWVVDFDGLILKSPWISSGVGTVRNLRHPLAPDGGPS